ncbi:MAG: hypothetical protein AVDCRST_MAG71-2581, partial [uncultured Lysobacter sp.]
GHRHAHHGRRAEPVRHARHRAVAC